MLAAMHDESLKLPKEDMSYGLIRGRPSPQRWRIESSTAACAHMAQRRWVSSQMWIGQTRTDAPFWIYLLRISADVAASGPRELGRRPPARFGRALPSAWVASGKEIRIDQAPTRWRRVNVRLISNVFAKTASADVDLPKAAAPKNSALDSGCPALMRATVNGRPATIGVTHNDCVMVMPGNERRFEIAGQLS
jgi:hypothetical protein